MIGASRRSSRVSNVRRSSPTLLKLHLSTLPPGTHACSTATLPIPLADQGREPLSAAMSGGTSDPRMTTIHPRIRYNTIGGVNGPLVILENVRPSPTDTKGFEAHTLLRRSNFQDSMRLCLSPFPMARRGPDRCWKHEVNSISFHQRYLS